MAGRSKAVLSRLVLAALFLVAAPLHAAADPARYMPVELIAETTTPRPGSMILVGFRFTPKPGWHGYWRNPGDSGIAPTVSWSAPTGVSFGALVHPAPTLISDGGISSFVHDGPHILLSRMTIPRSIPPGAAIPLTAKLAWAACTASQCVPLHATMALELVAGTGAKDPNAAALQRAAARLPKAAPDGSFNGEGKVRRLLLPASLLLNPGMTRFFPFDNDSFVTAGARAAREDGKIAVTGEGRGSAAAISGVVTDGASSYRVTFERAKDEPPVAQTNTTDAPVRVVAHDAAASSPANVTPAEAPIAEQTRQKSRHTWLIFVAAVLVLAGVAYWLLGRSARNQRPRI